MTFTIAIAGKGGTGKTTLAGILVDLLRQAGASPILAIDADPASNLNTVLDLPLERTVGDIREDTSEKARSGRLEAGVAKQDLLDYEINASIVEGPGVDPLAMGRPEGPGCYCAANNMLRMIVDRISASYEYVVIDNEAGLEHLSRRTTRDVDVLLIMSDASMRGLTTAGRIVDLIDELKTDVGRHYLWPADGGARARGQGLRAQPPGHSACRPGDRRPRRVRPPDHRPATDQPGIRGHAVRGRRDPPRGAKGEAPC